MRHDDEMTTRGRLATLAIVAGLAAIVAAAFVLALTYPVLVYLARRRATHGG